MLFRSFCRLQLSSASGATKPHESSSFRVVDQHSSSRHQAQFGSSGPGSPAKQSSTTSRVTPKGPLPPVNTRKSTSQIDVSDFLMQSTSQEPKTVPSNRALTRSAFKEGRKAISGLVKDSKEIKPLGSISKHVSQHRKEARTASSPQRGAAGLDYASRGSASLRQTRIPEESTSPVGYPLDVMSGSGGFRRIRTIENRIATPEGRRSGLLVSTLESRSDPLFFFLLFTGPNCTCKMQTGWFLRRPLQRNRELKKTATATSSRTSPNNTAKKQSNKTARVKHDLVGFSAAHCKTTRNEHFPRFVEYVIVRR